MASNDVSFVVSRKSLSASYCYLLSFSGMDFGWTVRSTPCHFTFFCVPQLQSGSLITKSDITNSGYNEAQKLVPAKILLYMNRNASITVNSGYNEISVLANWFCYPQWTIMPLVTNHMFGPCEKFKPDITKWLSSVREPFLQNNGQ